jgi:peptide/nickel transport system permease protein
MARSVLERLGHALLSMFALLVLVFLLVRATGDPAFFRVPPTATAEQREQARRELGVDQPVPVQFAIYVSDLAHGDLGLSFRTRTPVIDLVLQRLPATVALTISAVLLTVAVALPLGLYSAYYRGRVLDRAARGFAAIGQSVPEFWVGILLIIVFAVNLRVLPSGGYGSPEQFVLPTITLSFVGIAGLTRLLRSSVINELGSDYVVFLRAKGVPERVILWKHVLRNAGLTTLGFLGVLVAGLLTGSVLVETVFVWPGVGRLMIESIDYRDFTVLQGTMLIFAGVYIVINLLVDVLYRVLNPRLRR